MLKIKLSKINRKIKIDYLFICVLVMGVIFDDGYVMLLSFTAIFLHELGHILAMLILKVPVGNMRFMPFGIEVENKKYIKDSRKILIVLSGSIINLTIAFISSFFFDIIDGSRLFAGVNIVFGIFNLLPIISLDGGVILRIFLEKMLDFEVAFKILSIISWILFVLLTSLMCFCFTVFRVKFITLFSFVFVFLSYILNLREE